MNDIIYQVLLKDLTPNERANLSFKIQKQKIFARCKMKLK